MSKPDAGIEHPEPEALMRFMERNSSSDYVKQNAQWLRENYPGSYDKLKPRMLAMFKEKRAAEEKKRARETLM